VTGPAGTAVAIVSGSFVQKRPSHSWLRTACSGSTSQGSTGTRRRVSSRAWSRFPGTLPGLLLHRQHHGRGIFGSTSTVNVFVNGAPAFTDTNSNVSPTTLDWQQFTHAFVAERPVPPAVPEWRLRVRQQQRPRQRRAARSWRGHAHARAGLAAPPGRGTRRPRRPRALDAARTTGATAMRRDQCMLEPGRCSTGARYAVGPAAEVFLVSVLLFCVQV
jgi:hypothetical protein